MQSIENVPQLSKEVAIYTVGVILSEVALMGANDSEIPALNEIMEDLKSGKGDIDELVQRARDIRGSKQDYH